MGSPSSPLRIWDGWTTSVVQDPPVPSGSEADAGSEQLLQAADRLYACESLNAGAAGPRSGEGAEPFTLQWFLNVENQRHSRHGRWIPRVLEFAKHSGETLLGLGNGLGTDWLHYARNGASVIVCAPSTEQLGLIRRNFELRGLGGRFLHSSPYHLPIENASIDVACVSSLLHEVGDPPAVIQEVYRVLKPGGKVLAVTPAYYDIDYWTRIFFPLHSLFSGRQQAQEQRLLRFSARRLRRLFQGYSEPRVYKRHLRRAEVPHLWRWVPMPLLERLLGRVLVLKAFKPLSAASALRAAA